eukprot:m.462800 g.462800  ORF g.462800 m.462800 type:complete len:290 (+) comp22802_c0_seq1:114-983(+)
MAFYDLSVPLEHSPVETATMLVRLGYQTVALDHTIVGKIPADVSPVLATMDKARSACETAAHSDISGQTPRFLSRATVVLSDPSVAHLLNGTSTAMKEFDVIAVQPTTEKLWAQACEKLDVDLISLDLSKRLPFFVKPKQVNVALDRGLFLEIGYSAAISDVTARRNLISNAIQMVRASKQRGIVLSSNAARAMLARGPYDVANLARLFGMSPQVAKESLSVNCRAVVNHGAMRRGTSKGVTSVVDMSSMRPDEHWMVPPDLSDAMVEDDAPRPVDIGMVGPADGAMAT